MTKRLNEVSARLAPAMESIGAAAQHKEQTENFRQRLAQRVENIDKQLAEIPRPLKVDAAGVADLAGARGEPQSGGGRLALDKPEEAGVR